MLLASCSKDTYEELVQETKITLKVKNLKARDLKKQGNLVKKLDHFKAFTKLQNLNHKTETSSIYDFSIDTNNFKLIENDRVKYYTFKVTRTIDNGMLENLQITKKTDGTYVAKLLQYSLSTSEKALLLSGGRLDVNGKLKVVNIEDPDFLSNINLKFRGDCFDMIITTQENLCASGAHSYGQTCSLPPNLQPKPDSRVYTVVSGPCGDSGDNGLGDGVFSPPGGLGNQPLEPLDAFLTSLSAEQQQWLDNQSETTQGNIYSYLNVNNYNTTSSNYVSNLINYLRLNPNVSYEQYVNWFMTTSEGKDFSYDQSYWENQSLTFPSQNLPTYNAFFNAYPKNPNGSWMEGANNVYSYVGGAVQQARITYPNDTNNTCALKVSIALNGAGVTIPNIPGQTLQGGGQFANQYFFLNARALNKWMRKTFGTTTNPNYVNIPASQITPNGANLPSLLSNIQGIYSLVCPLGSTWASGHADIINNALCAAGCHFNDAPIEYIDIWKLN